LLDEPLAKLMAIADAWEAPVQAISLKDVVESLTAHMLLPEALNDVVDGLPSHAGEALYALQKAGGKMPAAAFERRFGVIRLMGPGRLDRERPWQAPVSAAEVLWYRGLIFRAFDRAPGAPVEVVYLPTELLTELATAGRAGHGIKDSAQAGTAPADTVAGDSASIADNGMLVVSPLLDDVTTILCFAQNNDVRVRADGVWDALSRQEIAPMLRDAGGVLDAHPDARFAFLLSVLTRLGWLRAQEGRVRLTSQPVTSWLQQTAKARREVLFNAWRNDPDWNDLAHIDGLERDMQHSWSNDPLRERVAILDMLDAWTNSAARWSTTAAFVAHIKSSNPDFARPDGRYDTWHIRDALTGAYLNGFEAWDRIEGALIQRVISGPLAWLEDSRVALPAAGVGEAPARPFAVQADGSVIVAGALAFERFQLARVADWQESQPGAFVYALTPRSLKRAADQGIKAARVIEFLEERSGGVLPLALQKAIDRWAERSSETRIERAVLLRTRDAQTLEALLKIDMVKRAQMERLAPNCLMIKARDARAVRAAIAAAGVLVDIG
jgi:hypothetical protein